VLGNGCVEVQKAAKQKQADEASIKKIVVMQKDLVNILRECLSAMNLTKDDAIISKDLLLMDDESRAYYQRKHQLIMARELEKEEKKELEEKEQHAKAALEANDKEEEEAAHNEE
jgi:CBS-domain-containing membrane protein